MHQQDPILILERFLEMTQEKKKHQKLLWRIYTSEQILTPYTQKNPVIKDVYVIEKGL